MQLDQPLNRYIDHSLLKPNAKMEEFEKLLEEAVKYNFASVCVSPHIALPAVQALKPYPDIKVCTVVGFPHGNIPTPLKISEAEYFVHNGVDEIDFVANIGLLRSGYYDEVGDELENMGIVCTDNGAIAKCTVETCYLTEDEKTFMYRALSERTSVDFIKTSTGFGEEGANLGDVFSWNRRRQEAIESKDTIISPNFQSPVLDAFRPNKPIKIKASGGIRGLAAALRFIACGADRLGMSTSVEVMEEMNARPSTFTEGEETA